MVVLSKHFIRIAAALVAVTVLLAFSGCPKPDDQGTTTSKTITWEVEQVDGVDGAATSTGILIKFSDAVSKLTTSNFTIEGAAEFSGEKFSQSGNNWTIPIYVNNPGTALVTISRTGVAPGTKNVTVFQAGVETPNTWTVQANGTDSSVDTTQLTFTFDEDVDYLDVEDITITNTTGAVSKGSLSGSGKTWVLAVTVGAQGNISIAIDKQGIDANAQTVRVHSDKVIVTFNSNGGSAVTPVTVAIGAIISRPTNPTRTFTGAITHFRGWYTDDGTFAQAFDFNSRVYNNITLYADWGYRAGDTGPGGGKIFYREDAGFTYYSTRSTTTGTTTAYYLEAAPQDLTGLQWWGAPRQVGGIPSMNQVVLIGGGMQSTLEFNALMTNNVAGNGCRSANYGGQTDWYLPTRLELAQLFRQRALIGNLQTTSGAPVHYWSSTAYDNQFAYAMNFRTGLVDTMQNGEYNVRAIRAF